MPAGGGKRSRRVEGRAQGAPPPSTLGGEAVVLGTSPRPPAMLTGHTFGVFVPRPSSGPSGLEVRVGPRPERPGGRGRPGVGGGWGWGAQREAVAWPAPGWRPCELSWRGRHLLLREGAQSSAVRRDGSCRCPVSPLSRGRASCGGADAGVRPGRVVCPLLHCRGACTAFQTRSQPCVGFSGTDPTCRGVTTTPSDMLPARFGDLLLSLRVCAKEGVPVWGVAGGAICLDLERGQPSPREGRGAPPSLCAEEALKN